MKNIRQEEHQNCIYMDAISYRYPGADSDIFRDFSASFLSGGWTAILAQSGRGKTTLLHLLAGLIKPTGGNIYYPAGSEKKPSFSMVFQENRLLEYESVLKNCKLVNDKLPDDLIKETLKKAGLSQYTNKKVSTLSGGEKRRCAIVRALSADFDVLLLDEPFTGLDGETKTTMMQLIKDSTKSKTMIFVTHDEKGAEFFDCSILRL